MKHMVMIPPQEAFTNKDNSLGHDTEGSELPLVLIIDDSMLSRHMISEALNGLGVQVAEARNGNEGLEIILQRPPDLVLLDVQMPDKDGFAICSAIRERYDPNQLPVVMVTVQNDMEAIEKAYHVGATDFVTKPFNTLILRERLRYILRTSSLHKKLRSSEERARMLSSAVKASPAMMMIVSASGIIEYVNPKHTAVSGFASHELIGRSMFDLLDDPKRREEISASLNLTSEWEGEVVAKKKNGTSYWQQASITAIRDDNNKISHFVTVAKDITERKRAEEEIRKAQAAAEAAHSAKSAFLANISHELRTPMNGIIGMTDLLLDSDLSPEQEECLFFARESAQSLLSLVNDILDFAKIEAGKLSLEQRSFDLRSTVKASLAILKMPAGEKGLNLSCHMGTEIPTSVMGDSNRLKQLLFNLVGNAIKFTDQGKIDVHVDTDDEDLHFSVTDTGIGIPAEKLEQIFERFVQADGSSTRRYGGIGLGLAISRDLITAMGGNIWAESDQGKGSTFHFTLPMVPSRNAGAACRTHEPGPSTFTKPIRILLAEDNFISQRLAFKILEKRGHSVVMVETGTQVLEALEKGAFDLILMDVQMPELDGLETTRTIRSAGQAKPYRNIPIIAMTAHAMEGDRERCLNAGMDDYLSKPIVSATLIKMVESYGSRQASDAPQPQIAESQTRMA